jgi:hypothetical protein
MAACWLLRTAAAAAIRLDPPALWRLGSYGHTVNQLFGTFFIVPK